MRSRLFRHLLCLALSLLLFSKIGSRGLLRDEDDVRRRRR
jgi:hypothetical protein